MPTPPPYPLRTVVETVLWPLDINKKTKQNSVGVGQADYTAMEALDGDDVRLRNSSGQAASRDIVQFVPMRDFVGKSSYALAKEVIAPE